MLSFMTRFRLKGQLKSPDIGTRSKAVETLAKNASDPAAVKLLVMVRNKEGGNGVGYTALKALESVNNARAVDALLTALRDGNADVRCAAAKALGNIRDARSVEGLCAAVGDSNGEVRWAAGIALGNIGDPRAASVLIDALSTSITKIKETHKEELTGWCNTALASSKALGQIGDKRAADVLVTTLRNANDWNIKRNAATSLGQVKDPNAVEVLAEVLGDSKNFKGNSHGITWEVQAAAAEALGHIGGPRAIEALTAVTSNATLKEAVRRTAEEALSRFGGGAASSKGTREAGPKKPYLMSGKEMASYLHKNVLAGMLEEVGRACQKDGLSYCSSMAIRGPTEGHAIVMDQLVLAVEFTPGSDYRPQEATIRSILNQHLAEPGWRLTGYGAEQEPSRNGGVWVKFDIERK
jgi:HEAT repeat protein